MPTAFKVVTDRYLSPAADDHPNLQYRLGPVRHIGPGGVYGYTALSSAVKRAYWARKSPRLMSKQRIVALDYDEADNLESGDGIKVDEEIFLGSGRRLRVLAVVPVEEEDSPLVGFLEVESAA